MGSKFVTVDKVIVNGDIEEFKRDINSLLKCAIKRYYTVYLGYILLLFVAIVYTAMVNIYCSLDTIGLCHVAVFIALWITSFIVVLSIDIDVYYEISIDEYCRKVSTSSIFKHRKELIAIKSLNTNDWFIKFMGICDLCRLVPARGAWTSLLQHRINYITYDIEGERLLFHPEGKPYISIELEDVSPISAIESGEVTAVLYFDRAEVVDESCSSGVSASVVYSSKS